MTRRIAALAVPVVVVVAAMGCNDSKPPDATRTAISVGGTSAAFIRTPFPTSTPIPFDRSGLAPAPDCPGCLVVRDVTTARAIDVVSGAVVTRSRLPAQVTVPVNWYPSPDGKQWVFPCNENGSFSPNEAATELCLWGYGASPEPIARATEGGAVTPGRGGRVVEYPGWIAWNAAGDRFVLLSVVPRVGNVFSHLQQMDVFVHDTTAGVTKRVAESQPHEQWSEPAWSPAGDRLALGRTRSGIYTNVVIVDATTGDATLLFPESTPGLSIGKPVWSADGEHIAFARTVLEPETPVEGVSRSKRDAIVIARVDGSTVLELPVAGGSPLAWSPDGRWVLVQRADPPSEATGYRLQPLVFAVRTDGSSSEHILSEGFVEITHPVFSPDGSRVAFIGTGDPNDNTTRGLFVVSIEGGDPVKMPLPHPAFGPPTPVWAKDGRRIVYSTVGGCYKGGCSSGALFIVEVSGESSPIELLPSASQILGWLPE